MLAAAAPIARAREGDALLAARPRIARDVAASFQKAH